MKYVSVEMIAKNTEESEYVIANFIPSNTYFLTPEGEMEIVKKVTWLKIEKAKKNGNIEPGGVIQVVNTFEVPKEQKDLQIVYEYRPVGFEKILFKVN